VFFGLAAVAGYFIYKKCNANKAEGGLSKEEKKAAQEAKKREKALQK